MAVTELDLIRDTSTLKPAGIVSEFLICVPNLVGEERWATPVSGPPQSASMSLSFRVVCAENYFGPDCSRYCASNCTCDPGYTGEFCHETDDCLGVNCSGNGVCLDDVDSFICQCETGYSGALCDETEGVTS